MTRLHQQIASAISGSCARTPAGGWEGSAWAMDEIHLSSQIHWHQLKQTRKALVTQGVARDDGEGATVGTFLAGVAEHGELLEVATRERGGEHQAPWRWCDTPHRLSPTAP
jgi:hypothetical protein